jgi:hypothetical protein
VPEQAQIKPIPSGKKPFPKLAAVRQKPAKKYPQLSKNVIIGGCAHNRYKLPFS